jgi:acetyl esterase/lipase
VTAWRWLLKQGGKAGRAAIAGDSAGGGLAVAAMLKLRELGEPLPACAFLSSPWTDLAGTGASVETNQAADPTVKVRFLTWFSDLYLKGAEPRMPLASPLYADLKGLPPMLIHVGSVEILLDDATRLAERARAAGVEVECEVWPDMLHVWHLFAPMLSEGREAIAKAGAFIARRTGG